MWKTFINASYYYVVSPYFNVFSNTLSNAQLFSKELVFWVENWEMNCAEDEKKLTHALLCIVG